MTAGARLPQTQRSLCRQQVRDYLGASPLMPIHVFAGRQEVGAVRGLVEPRVNSDPAGSAPAPAHIYSHMPRHCKEVPQCNSSCVARLPTLCNHRATPCSNHTQTWSPGLDALSGLAELYAGGNPLASLRALRPLHALRGLAALDLAGCPAAALPDCRAHCVFHLAALQARPRCVFCVCGVRCVPTAAAPRAGHYCLGA